MGVRVQVGLLSEPGRAPLARFEFDQTRIVVGRGAGVDICLPHRAVSLRHLTIEHSQRGYELLDHGSTNGTRINDKRVVSGRSTLLANGDIIEIAGFRMLFECDRAVGTTGVERTASLARQLLRAIASDEHAKDLHTELIVRNGPDVGQVHSLPSAPARVTVGRATEADIVIDDADASRQHAEVVVAADGIRVRALAAKNGLLVNQSWIEERELVPGDEVTIGSTVLLFADPAEQQVQTLMDEDDEPYAPPPAAAPIQEPVPQAAEAKLRRRKRGSQGLSVADALVYIIASAIFATSVLALVWILGS